MRLWSLHPRYLDAKGLVAFWREGLLARHVLQGRTRGYRNHPQLDRFRAAPDPLAALDACLHLVADEADARGYHFDRNKLGKRPDPLPCLTVTRGQLEYEAEHLGAKLAVRDPGRQELLRGSTEPSLLFHAVEGPVEDWEKVRDIIP